MWKGGKKGLSGNVTFCRIGDVGREVAAVDRHRGLALKEVVQHVVPFVAAYPARSGLTEQLTVHFDGRDCLEAREYGFVVADHGPAVGEYEAHGRHGRIATGLSPHGYPGHRIGPDCPCGDKQL